MIILGNLSQGDEYSDCNLRIQANTHASIKERTLAISIISQSKVQSCKFVQNCVILYLKAMLHTLRLLLHLEFQFIIGCFALYYAEISAM